MYGQVTTAGTFARACSDFVLGEMTSQEVKTVPQLPLPLPLPQLVVPLRQSQSYHHQNCQYYLPLAPTEFDQVSEALRSLNSEVGHASSGTSSGGCSICNSPSSFTRSNVMQRSISSHNGFYGHFASAHELVDRDTGPVRRVFSTGDLHRINMWQHGHGQRADSPLSNESNAIIEGMSKACKYSPEEKKERIERYRSKRNLRNFNKKIKYACRKTLADSRPRIRGRFARNDEIEKNRHVQSGEEDEEDDDNWINFLNSFSANQFLNL